MEYANQKTNAYVKKIGLVQNVKSQHASEFLGMSRKFVVVTEIAKTPMYEYVSQVGQVLMVLFRNVLEKMQQMRRCVQEGDGKNTCNPKYIGDECTKNRLITIVYASAETLMWSWLCILLVIMLHM